MLRDEVSGALPCKHDDDNTFMIAKIHKARVSGSHHAAKLDVAFINVYFFSND